MPRRFVLYKSYIVKLMDLGLKGNLGQKSEVKSRWEMVEGHLWEIEISSYLILRYPKVTGRYIEVI